MMELYKIMGEPDMVKQKFLFRLSNSDKGICDKRHFKPTKANSLSTHGVTWPSLVIHDTVSWLNS